MKALRHILLALFCCGWAMTMTGAEAGGGNDGEAKAGADSPTAKEAKPAAAQPPPLSPRFKQVREKISALFQHRNAPPAPPDPRANPFRPPGVAVVAPAPTVASGDAVLLPPPDPEPPSSDLMRLQESVATLKFGGTLERGGNLYLMINGKPYKENEVVTTQVQGETVYLRVRQISRRGVTIVLNEAEVAWKF